MCIPGPFTDSWFVKAGICCENYIRHELFSYLISLFMNVKPEVIHLSAVWHSLKEWHDTACHVHCQTKEHISALHLGKWLLGQFYEAENIGTDLLFYIFVSCSLISMISASWIMLSENACTHISSGILNSRGLMSLVSRSLLIELALFWKCKLVSNWGKEIRWCIIPEWSDVILWDSRRNKNTIARSAYTVYIIQVCIKCIQYTGVHTVYEV